MDEYVFEYQKSNFDLQIFKQLAVEAYNTIEFPLNQALYSFEDVWWLVFDPFFTFYGNQYNILDHPPVSLERLREIIYMIPVCEDFKGYLIEIDPMQYPQMIYTYFYDSPNIKAKNKTLYHFMYGKTRFISLHKAIIPKKGDD